ncbi:hypothetical protein FRB99_002964 [Tulasnella sp. 403]|nr:hypothetical protein FRB99_002964 [Tulasnella sp. 403]
MKTLPSISAIILSLSFRTLGDLTERQTACPDVVMPTPPIYAQPNGTKVSNLQLDTLSDGTAILTKSGLHLGWNFTNGGLGYPWCPTLDWLNILPSTHPWSRLLWEKTQKTATWIAGYNAYLAVNTTADASKTSNFLACQPITPVTSTPADVAKAPYWTLLSGNVPPVISDDTLSNVVVESCVITKLYVGPGFPSVSAS